MNDTVQRMAGEENKDPASRAGRENNGQQMPEAVAVQGILSDEIVQHRRQPYPMPVVQVVYQQPAADNPRVRDNRDVQCCYPVSVFPHLHRVRYPTADCITISQPPM